MRPFLAFSVVGMAICLGVSAAAGAQPVVANSSSVEWIAARSPLIVRGVIEEISPHHPGDPFHRYQTVSVRVLETVRGPRSGRLQFVHDGDFGPFRLAQLRDDRRPLLLFLDHWALSPRFDRAGGGYAYA